MHDTLSCQCRQHLTGDIRRVTGVTFRLRAARNSLFGGYWPMQHSGHLRRIRHARSMAFQRLLRQSNPGRRPDLELSSIASNDHRGFYHPAESGGDGILHSGTIGGRDRFRTLAAEVAVPCRFPWNPSAIASVSETRTDPYPSPALSLVSCYLTGSCIIDGAQWLPFS